MRFPGRAALFGLLVGLSIALSASAAEPPTSLLKPVTPAGGQVRVRLPVTPGFPKCMSFPAQVPNGKKKSELIKVTVALDTLPGTSYIMSKKLEALGYEVPNSKEFLLPELVIRAGQISPKLPKGHDTAIRLTNIKLTVIETPAGSDNNVYDSDLSVSSAALYQGAERTLMPRVSFGDKFLEMNVPTAIIKRPGTSETMIPEVTVSMNDKLTPAVGPMVVHNGLSVFAYAAVNGQTTFKKPDGTIAPVNATVSSVTTAPSGVLVTVGLVRGCDVLLDPPPPGATIASTGKLKEFRLGLMTGPGLKVQKDIVIKDLPVVVDHSQSEGYVLLGQKFMDTYFVDGVYAADATGWKLHGRVDPQLLADIKTRPKQK